MSKDRLIQSIALTANCVTILGLLLVILQLHENRTLMRAQVRHELANTVVDILNTAANNSQLAGVWRRGGLGEQLTEDEQMQYRLRANAILRYWEDVHYQFRLGLYDEIEYSRQKEAWKAGFTKPGFVKYWSEVRNLYSPLFAAELDGLLPTQTVTQPEPAHP